MSCVYRCENLIESPSRQPMKERHQSMCSEKYRLHHGNENNGGRSFAGEPRLVVATENIHFKIQNIGESRINKKGYIYEL